MTETTRRLSAEADGGSKGEPRRLIVLRHGQTGSNLKGIWQGQLDHELTDLGREQARAAAAAIASLRPTRVVSSDLVRARDTAEEVAAASGGLSVALDERWREIHAGGWQGLTAAQVAARYPEDAERLVSGEDFRRGGHGESLADVARRTRSALDELIASMDPGECVVIATHGVTGRSLVAELVGIDQTTAWRVLGGFGNCHWASLEEGRAGWRITQWNASAEGL
ncbi:histidine phosphatase family protein [Janibacter hoylei]|uniref:histidine phosphatase family protein n=1 Tax=Janibacter hoylei TaxID=364298 RepID=UPI0022370687|nr:histidine phosphatase family protein [Janibacter hoylei]MCW4602809.1 histidine phosphatase family protein [Janibacter hoylei]